MGFFHYSVALCFCKNRGRGDVGIFSVAFYYSSIWGVAIGFESVSVDYYCAGADGERIEGEVHCFNGCVENIDFVDTIIINYRYGVGQGLLHDDCAKLVAPLFGELLGIVEEGMCEIVGENDCGSHNWAGKTAAPGFIATGFVCPGVEARREGVMQGCHSL